MDRERETLQRVAEFLLAHGYPEESLAIDWRIGDKYQADLAVVDPMTNKPLAILEFKQRETPQSMSLVRQQLLKYAEELRDPGVSFFAVFGDDSPDQFSFYRLVGNATADTLPARLERTPDFRLLRSTQRRKEGAAVERERKRSLDRLQVSSWILAGVVGVLLLLDFCKLIHVSAERLTLIGLVAALVVIPFASKLNFLGVQFERFVERERDDRE